MSLKWCIKIVKYRRYSHKSSELVLTGFRDASEVRVFLENAIKTAVGVKK